MEDAGGGLFHLEEGLELLELLGRGGSGAVYRARDTVLGRTVAVKVLRGVFGADPAELLTEARVQASVGSHSNVLTVLGHGVTDDGWQYLVLEDAAGGSLRERVVSKGPLPVGETLRLCDELVDALSFAHASGVVHCDVKPSNVLFSEDGSVRLADFGTALSSSTQTLEFLQGSLVFAPPELLEGRRPTGANDVYGMAVTAWFALAGGVPFGGLDQPAAAVIARIHSEELTFDGLGLPAALQALFERCVDKDPSARPDIGVVSAALRRKAGAGDEVTPARGVRDYRTAELRQALSTSIAERRSVIERVFTDFQSDLPAVEKVRMLIQDIATDSATAMKPLIDIASRDCPALGGRTVTIDQLRRLVIGDVTLMLAGHPSLIFDGGEAGQPGGPQLLQEISWIASEANRWAAEMCPDVDVDLSPARQQRGWVLLGQLSDPRFLDEFFDDPSSAAVFDPLTISILLATGRSFFEALIKGRGEWVVTKLLGREDLRRMIAFDHPFVVLLVLADEPELADRVDEHLRNELQLGLSRMTASERAGIRSVYAAELEAIGLSI
jgi:hypothetical protein